ncbi:MAG: hypothetical protein H7A46_14065 [Verrucomicrobiales bacterium]|nr:hypothetical protein [Verrucomicrobiales bacterium]
MKPEPFPPESPARQPKPDPKPRSAFGHYLPRLQRVFYQGDAVVFWTLPVAHRARGWLDQRFHTAFREIMLHAAGRAGLLCPAYCLMPDHLHLVWMGLRHTTDQRNGMKFLRAQLGRHLAPARFQHQPYDHVLSPRERQRQRFTLACTDYVLLNPVRAGLVTDPNDWPFLGAIVLGYPRADPLEAAFWPRFWKWYAEMREPGLEKRKLPPRCMEPVGKSRHP